MFYIVNFLGVFEHRREHPYRYVCKKRPFDVLCYRAEGETHFLSKNQAYTSKQGSIVFIPKNTEYSQSGQGGERLIAIHFVADRTAAEGIRVFEGEAAAALAPRLQNILIGYKNSGYAPTEALMAELYGIISALFHSSAKPQTPWERARTVFEAHYLDTDFSVLEWATALGVSRTYLQNLCMRENRLSPCTYLSHRRLSYAASLLLSGEKKVKSIAFMCGYYSEKNFLRAFAHHFGMPCTEYRKKHSVEIEKQ